MVDGGTGASRTEYCYSLHTGETLMKITRTVFVSIQELTDAEGEDGLLELLEADIRNTEGLVDSMNVDFYDWKQVKVSDKGIEYECKVEIYGDGEDE
jgi:hypothetical protein